jgi:hypothetical protein
MRAFLALPRTAKRLNGLATILNQVGLDETPPGSTMTGGILVRRGVRTINMPLPGKVERPQWVTRPRRTKAGSNVAEPRLPIICAPKATGYPLALIALRVGEVPPFSR